MTTTTLPLKHGKCGFSHAGTFGHECGKPATLAGSKPCEHTVDGVFWSARCERCAKEPGRDNWGVKNWVPFDPALHVNRWL